MAWRFGCGGRRIKMCRQPEEVLQNWGLNGTWQERQSIGWLIGLLRVVGLAFSVRFRPRSNSPF